MRTNKGGSRQAHTISIHLTQAQHTLTHKIRKKKKKKNRCSNAHFQAKVAARRGGVPFLLALGFVEEVKGGMGHELARDAAGFTVRISFYMCIFMYIVDG